VPDDPRISVALAVRNGEAYLEPLLASLARQTRPPFELVAVDDASQDSTPSILADFAGDAPFPVRIERFPERRGHVEGFVHGGHLCRGELVAWCDGDDVWLEPKLEHCGRELVDTDASLVLHQAHVVDGALQSLGRIWPEIKQTELVPPLGLTGLEVDAPTMAMVYRRELLEVGDFASRPPSRYGHGRQMLNDEWMFFLAGVLGPIRLLAEPLLLYRRHGANDSPGALEHRRRLTLRPVMEDYRNAAAHTAACAGYLERTRSDDARMAALLAEGARRYRSMAESWERRVELYESDDRRTRVRLLRRLVADRAYAARTVGGFGRAALAKDVAGALRPSVGH